MRRKKQRGGSRPGAGRPRSRFHLSPNAARQLRDLVERGGYEVLGNDNSAEEAELRLIELLIEDEWRGRIGYAWQRPKHSPAEQTPQLIMPPRTLLPAT